MKKVPRIFAIRLFVNGKRKLSHELTKHEARCFKKTSQHLSRYLTSAYKLRERKSWPRKKSSRSTRSA